MKSILFASTTLAIALAGAELKQTGTSPSPEVQPLTSPKALHDEFERRFVASPGFGMSRIIRPIFTAPAAILVHNGASYRIVPPDLIGLENSPAVYSARDHIYGTLK